ncbi:hypothetical protein VIGAN_08119600 [Vigna angularis var. angularis]|uniref:Purple acid phosphatase N-terminal domain-containing protein n=1 Tax=Vigna angularis var. angularis TaxID=157739 RepID=A0A0S3SNZ1_PHAAN|nr:hypothetical protein VIGAN_08119600 [Vigna angularis var. angularis]
MRISWITDSPTSPKVSYGPSPSANALSVTGTTSSYRYLFYKSGEIHDVVIGPLNPNTVYYYRLGDPPSSLTYNFKTPPSQLPIKFAVVDIMSLPPPRKTSYVLSSRKRDPRSGGSGHGLTAAQSRMVTDPPVMVVVAQPAPMVNLESSEAAVVPPTVTPLMECH